MVSHHALQGLGGAEREKGRRREMGCCIVSVWVSVVGVSTVYLFLHHIIILFLSPPPPPPSPYGPLAASAKPTRPRAAVISGSISHELRAQFFRCLTGGPLVSLDDSEDWRREG